MNDTPATVSDTSFRRRQDGIRRSLQRANTAAIATLLVVIALAVAAILQALRSDRQRARAEHAENIARTKLYEASLAQARAERLSDRTGSRQNALETLSAAARLRLSIPGTDPLPLRNETIAVLARDDLQPDGSPRPLPPGLARFTLSPDLAVLALALTNGTVSLRKAGTGEELGHLAWTTPTTNGRSLSVAALEFSPDGATLALVTTRGHVHHLDPRTSQTRLLPGAARAEVPAPVRFSPDGRRLAVLGRDEQVQILDLSTNPAAATATLSLAPKGVRAFAFHPELPRLALGIGRETRIMAWDSGQVLRTFTNRATVDRLAFRPDGRQIAVADAAGELTLWHLDAGTPIRLPNLSGTTGEIAYSPRGDSFAAALGDSTVHLWDAYTGEPRHRLEGARLLRFARDGSRLAFERPGEGVATCTVVDSDVHRWFPFDLERQYRRRFWSVDLSRDQRWIAAVDDAFLVIWDSASGETVATQRGARRLSVYWLEGEQAWLTSGAQGISLWPMTTNATPGRPTFGEPRHIHVDVSASMGQSTIAPDGHTVAIVTSATDGLILDLQDPRRRTALRGPAYLGHLVFSPDGRWLAGSSTAASLLVWDAHTGQLVHEHPGPHGRMAWSPDGRHVVSGGPRAYTLFTAGTWQPDPARTLQRDNVAETTGPSAYSPQSEWLAIARDRQLATLVDGATGAELAALRAAQPHSLSWLRFSTDRSLLAAATFDGGVQLWNLHALRRHLATFNLDWENARPAGTPPPPRPAPTPPGGSQLFIGLTLGAVALALLGAVFALARQRRLLQDHLNLHTLAAQRAQELEAAQSAVIHAQKMKALGTLAAGIAHDFNNLLSVIRMSNQLTREETRAQPDVQENVREIEQAVLQGKKLVRSMLGYSREDPDDTRPVSLPDLVEDTVGLLSKEFLSGIALTLELDRDTPPARGPRSRLEQILLNLVVNAAEAMNGRGTLRIRTALAARPDHADVLSPKPATRFLELSVSDTGSGIAAHLLPHIFEPFFTTKPRSAASGTGLGLSMVYQTAEQEGWGLGVATSPGQGTTFWILLPVPEATPEPEPAPPGTVRDSHTIQ